MGLFVYSAATGRPFWTPPLPFVLFILADWMVFNVFEFGRKTFGREEEQAGVDSYSKRFGPTGAVAVTVAMAFTATAAVTLPGIGLQLHPLAQAALAVLMLAVVAAAARYALSPLAPQGRLFRGTCGAFILLFNLIVTAGLFACRPGGLPWKP
jgi:4-hydroxybenzoate polyprenyltransferase